VLETCKGGVIDLKFSPDANYLVTISEDGAVTLFTLNAGSYFRSNKKFQFDK